MFKDCDIAHIIKDVVLGMSKTALNTATKIEERACQLTEIVFKSVDTECQGLKFVRRKMPVFYVASLLLILLT